MENSFIDKNTIHLDKSAIDSIYYELNKELRRKFRGMSKDYRADLYVVDGANIVTSLHTRQATLDIDAMWTIGSDMRDCINKVSDRLGLSHEVINCNFKTTKSYTNAIITNSSVYKVYDRLVVRNVNPDLLLCMKLVAFRKEKKSDIDDINNLVLRFRALGRIMDTNEVCNLIIKYYGSLDVLSKEAKEFLHL